MFTPIGKFYNPFGPEKSRDIAFFPMNSKARANMAGIAS